MAYYRDNPSGLGTAMPRPAVIRPAMPSPAVTAYAASVTAPAKRAQLVIGTGTGCDLAASGTATATDAVREQDLRRVTGAPAGAAILIRRTGFATVADYSINELADYDREDLYRMVAGGDLLVRDFNNILLAPTVSGAVNPCRFYRPAEYWDGRRPFNSLVQPLYYIIDRTNGPKFAKRVRLGWNPLGSEVLFTAANRRIQIGNGRFYYPRVQAHVDPCFVWRNNAAFHRHHHIGLAPAAHYIRIYNVETGYFSWLGLDAMNRCVSTTTEEGILGVWDRGMFSQLPRMEREYAREWDRLRNFTAGTGRECDGKTWTIEAGPEGTGGVEPREIYSEFVAPTAFALKPDGDMENQLYNFSVHMHGYYPPLATKLTEYGPQAYAEDDIGMRKKYRSGRTDARLPNTWDMLTNGSVPVERHARIPIALHPVAFRVLNLRGTKKPALFVFNAAGEAIACSYMADLLAAAKGCTPKSRWGSFLKIVKAAAGPVAGGIASTFLGPQAGAAIGKMTSSIVAVAAGDAKLTEAVQSAIDTGLNFYCGGGFSLRGLSTIATAAMSKAGPAFEAISGIPQAVYSAHLVPTAKLMMPALNRNLPDSVRKLGQIDFATALMDPRTQRLNPNAAEILRAVGLPAETARGFDIGISRLAQDKPVTADDLQYFNAQLKQVAVAGVGAISDDVERMKTAAGTFVGGGNYGAVNGFDAIVQHQLGGRHPDLEDPTVLDAVRSIYAPPDQFGVPVRIDELPGDQLRSVEAEMWNAVGGTTNIGVPYPIDFDDPARRASAASRSAAARAIAATARPGAAARVDTAMARSADKSAANVTQRVRGSQTGGNAPLLAGAGAIALLLLTS